MRLQAFCTVQSYFTLYDLSQTDLPLIDLQVPEHDTGLHVPLLFNVCLSLQAEHWLCAVSWLWGLHAAQPEPPLVLHVKHVLVLHARVSVALPEHWLPPYLGDGLVQLRLRVCVPPPHVLEQPLNEVQPDQPPWMGQ